MASCPDHPDHRCWDCAPTRRGRPFNPDGLSAGSPFTNVDRDPPADPQDRIREFAGLFARETVTRSSKTFDFAEPNHDGVVVTVNKYATPKPATAKKRGPSKTAARQALLDSITVTFTDIRL